jgi:hypothetical protein
MRLTHEIKLMSRDLCTVLDRRGQSVQSQCQLAGQFRCLKCETPHDLCIESEGWHLARGVE